MIFHINLKIVKTFLSVFLFSQLIYCTSMTFVLQLHFVKMKLNLKQKKNAKKDVLRFDYLLNASAPSSDCNSIERTFACIHSLFLNKSFHSHPRSDRTVMLVHAPVFLYFWTGWWKLKGCLDFPSLV